MDISIEITSGISTTEVPEDVAKELQDTFDVMKHLPNNRVAVTDFYTGEDKSKATEEEIKEASKAARLFVKQGMAWAESTEIDGQTLIFSRRGNVKADPTRVQFRIYRPDTDAEKKAKKAAAEKAKADKAAEKKASK